MMALTNSSIHLLFYKMPGFHHSTRSHGHTRFQAGKPEGLLYPDKAGYPTRHDASLGVRNKCMVIFSTTEKFQRLPARADSERPDFL